MDQENLIVMKCLSMLLFVLVPLFASRTDKDAELEARAQVVAIGWGGNNCAAGGIIIGEDVESVYITTTAHGHIAGNRVTVLFNRPLENIYAGRILPKPFQKVEDGDLGVVVVAKDEALAKFTSSLKWDIVTQRKSPPRESPLHTIGCSGSKAWSSGGTNESLFEIRSPNIQIRSDARGGQSGGGVFDESWELIGMVQNRVQDRVGARQIDSILNVLTHRDASLPILLRIRAPQDRIRGPYEVAQQEAKRSLTRLLIARAGAVEDDDGLAALLAIEAFGRIPSVETDQLLSKLVDFAPVEHEPFITNHFVLSLPDDRIVVSRAASSGVSLVWDRLKERLIGRLADPLECQRFAMSQQGGIMVGGSKGGATVWRVTDSKALAKITTPGVQNVAISPDGNIVALRFNERIETRAQNGDLLATISLKGRGQFEEGLALADGGRWIVVQTSDSFAVVDVLTDKLASWKPLDAQCAVGRRSEGSCSFNPIEIDPLGRQVKVKLSRLVYDAELVELARGHASYNGEYTYAALLTVDIRSGRISHRLEASKRDGQPFLQENLSGLLLVSNQSNRFLTGGPSQLLTLAQIGNVKTSEVLPLSEGVVYCAISRDGQLAAGIGGDAVLRVWDLSRKRIIGAAPTVGEIRGLGFSKEGKSLLLGMKSGELWKLPVDKLHAPEVVSKGAPLTRFTISRNGEALLLRREGENEVIDSRNYQTLWKEVDRAETTHAALSDDGKTVVILTRQKSLRNVNISTGQEVWRLSLTLPGFAVALSSDGTHVAVADSDGIAVWELQNKEFVRRLSFESKRTEGIDNVVAFASDDKTLLIRHDSGSVQESVYRLHDIVVDSCSKIRRRLSKADWDKHVGEGTFEPFCTNRP